jgi:hypothetical protein
MKPLGAWCAHWKRESGCDIYESRPGACRSFQCSWIKGRGEEKDRPDRTKVVIDSVPPLVEEMNENVLRMAEVSVGALGGAYARQMTESMLHRGVFVMHMYLGGKRRLYWPRSKVLQKAVYNQLTSFGVEIVR